MYPAGVIIVAPVLIPKLYAKESVACHECHMQRLPKAHELPLYDTSHEKEELMKAEETISSLEEAIGLTRRSAEKYIVTLEGVRKRAVEIYDTGIAHTKNTYEYVTEDGNVVPRTVAIVSGGLVGLLLSVKGGIFKKLLCSSGGVAVAASACYPMQAKEYTHRGYVVAKENAGKLIKNYAGYDINTTINLKEKFSQLKSGVNIDDLTKSLKSYFKKLQSVDTAEKQAHSDPGQSNPKDKDMYTTRN